MGSWPIQSWGVEMRYENAHQDTSLCYLKSGNMTTWYLQESVGFEQDQESKRMEDFLKI